MLNIFMLTNKMTKIHEKLLAAFILLAPLSFVPYAPFPVLDFPSFRIGLYQVLAVLFVALSTVRFYPIYKSIVERHKVIFIVSGFLVLSTLSTLPQSGNVARSLLLWASLCLLVLVMLYAAAVVASWTQETRQKYVQSLIRPGLWAGIAYSFVSFWQLAVTSLADANALLCRGCVAEFFGFVRINGFGAEPLFWANSLLPFVFLAAWQVLQDLHAKLARASLFLTTIAITLTFARGGYAAVFTGACVLCILVRPAVKRFLGLAAVMLLAVVAGFTMMIGSAVWRYPDAPYVAHNTAVGLIEHVSLGRITLERKFNVPLNLNQAADLGQSFVSAGYVEESGEERAGASRLALDAWNDSLDTQIFGVGLGNLGSYIRQNIEPTAPESQTVYVFYVLFLSEAGILGLALFMALYGIALVRLYRRQDKTSLYLTSILVAFLVQYWFFGSYINAVYVWLWLGIALGFGVQLRAKR
jgi:hypothetical protein